MPVDLSPISVLREAVKAVPAVKWALGVGGVLATVALVYTFKLNPRVAFIGLIVMFIAMGVLVIFARVAAERNAAALPAMIFTWFVLLIFMATSTCLFTSVFFSKPLDLQEWLTGKATAATTLSEPLPKVDDVWSDWMGGGSSPHGFCDPILKSQQAKYPNYNITLITLPEQHRSEYNPFKHDYYKYGCSFAVFRKLKD